MTRSLYDLDPGQLEALVAEAGEPPYRARQLVHWLDGRRQPDPRAMTNLPRSLRARLSERFAGAGLTLDQHQAGDDGWTHKFLFRLPGGRRGRVGPDAVPAGRLQPRRGLGGGRRGSGGRKARPPEGRGRATVCISSQAGCAMGCTFCATGQFGFTRHLSAGEIVEQVARVSTLLPELRPGPAAPDHLTNVVFMGMGEPFANQEATWGAAHRLHQGFGLSARAITISTVGLVPGIRRAATEPLPVNLAVSIHAADDATRDRLVPVNRTWPIAELLDAVRDYVTATRRRVSFEYALMDGVNDDLEQAGRLGRLLAPLRVPGSGGHAAHVNLIPYNPTPGIGFSPPSKAAVRRFRDTVAASGVPVSVRANRGVGIDAACGQLRTTAGPGRGDRPRARPPRSRRDWRPRASHGGRAWRRPWGDAMTRPTGVALLGSTGSIGEQALDVIRRAPERFRVVALAAGRSADKLAAQARELRPAVVGLVDEAAAAGLAAELPPGCRLAVGPEAVAELAAAEDADVVLNGVTGSVGLAPTLRALESGRRLALANKESLIVGGELVTGMAKPGQIVPVDSEHSGLAQCLRAGRPEEVARLVVTASGGPFRGRSAADLADVTPAEALAHPTWAMGPVITVNSATLMNKGLEVIEAHLLFDVPYDRIEVVVHPQSVVHAMVEWCDGSTVAQLSMPDMRLPIGLALGWPDRDERPVGRVDWTGRPPSNSSPSTGPPSPCSTWPCAPAAQGATAPAALNAANEEAVAAFLEGRLPFPGIAEVVGEVLERHRPPAVLDLEALLATERWSRDLARTLVEDLITSRGNR